MITYVLSNLGGAWHVHRYDDNITIISFGIGIEEEAIGIALKAAQADRPSRVVRISVHGDHQVISTFHKDEESSAGGSSTPG